MAFVLETTGSDRLRPRPDDLAFAVGELAEANLEGDEQVAVRDQILAFCAANPDALHRGCVPGHLTGSALVVNAACDRVLLIHHKKLDRWLQPGGHADGEGNLAHVALKEASEETGILNLQVIPTVVDVDIHEIPARGTDPTHLHHDVRFVVLAPADAQVRPNHETNGAVWVEVSDAGDRIESEEVRRLVHRGLAVASAYLRSGA